MKNWNRTDVYNNSISHIYWVFNFNGVFICTNFMKHFKAIFQILQFRKVEWLCDLFKDEMHIRTSKLLIAHGIEPSFERAAARLM